MMLRTKVKIAVLVAVVALGTLMLSGCAMGTFKEFNFEGAQASAFCTTGGPGGVLGVGPGGIIAGGKMNDDFKGRVEIQKDCSMSLETK